MFTWSLIVNQTIHDSDRWYDRRFTIHDRYRNEKRHMSVLRYMLKRFTMFRKNDILQKRYVAKTIYGKNDSFEAGKLNRFLYIARNDYEPAQKKKICSKTYIAQN